MEVNVLHQIPASASLAGMDLLVVQVKSEICSKNKSVKTNVKCTGILKTSTPKQKANATRLV